MIIGIDGNEANVQNRVGIGQYAYQLLKNIHKELKKRGEYSKLKFLIFLKNAPLLDMPEKESFWKYTIFGPQKLWTQVALPLNLFKMNKNLDLFFSPSHYSPRISPVKTVISIMDMSFVHFPQLFSRKDLWQLQSWTAYSVRKAIKIFTISEFSKKEIIRCYKIDASKVVVTYPGIDQGIFHKTFSKREIAQIKSKYNLAGDYILFVGTVQPRKNINGLLRAFKELKLSNKLKLVIVGKQGWLTDEIYGLVKKLDLTDSVIFTGYVEAEDLPLFYKEAKCFVLPSFYEGFGIPVIEAMDCGCPVVVSNRSSLPEIAADAGILVDPDSIGSITRGIREAILDNKKRSDMIRKGKIQVGKYSWEKTAKITLNTLIKIVRQ